MASDDFYADLPVLEHFSGVCAPGNYRELPDDWCIVVGDVQDSTGAIRAGHYKGVNVLGVSIIAAVQNVAKPLAIPCIFGGDGASLAIPGRLVPKVRQALVATRTMAERQFGLHLRVGIIPCSAIRAAGNQVLIAKHRVSRYFVQCAFAGGGIEYAESLLKDPEAGRPFRFEGHAAPEDVDFSGLECRWQAVPSRHGEIIALIVKSLAEGIDRQAAFYDEVLDTVHGIYGDDENCRPLHEEGLRMTYDPRKLQWESGVRGFGVGAFGKLRRYLFIVAQNVIGSVFFAFRMQTGGVPWDQYKPDLVLNTDFRKFDGLLREVISGTAEQRERLIAWLESRRAAGECVYGIHASPAALFTCLISKRHGDHLHFVDGADGGYAMAAAAMKEQIRNLPASA